MDQGNAIIMHEEMKNAINQWKLKFESFLRTSFWCLLVIFYGNPQCPNFPQNLPQKDLEEKMVLIEKTAWSRPKDENPEYTWVLYI